MGPREARAPAALGAGAWVQEGLRPWGVEGADEDSLRFGEARFVHGESCTGGGALDSGRFPVGPCRCGALGYPECRAPGLLREAGLTPAFSKAGQGSSAFGRLLCASG